MKTLAPVRPTLAKLIPRLGSNHDGERLATVEAIKRTLGSAGCDWHDFAASVAQDHERRPRHNKFDDVEAGCYWAILPDHQRQAWLDILQRAWCLTPWEKNFVTDIRARTICFCHFPRSRSRCSTELS